MTKIDPKQKILELDGTPAKNSGLDLTVGFVLTFILNSAKCDALVAYRIILNCNKEKEFELNVDHTKIVKDEIIKFAQLEFLATGVPRPFSNIVFGQILSMLEGEEVGIVARIEPTTEAKGDAQTPIQSSREKKV